MTDFARTRWSDPGWLAKATGWATDQLAEQGYVVTGAPEQAHVRPWSTALRIPTTAGPFWFKANAIGTAHEVPLLQTLARVVPDQVLTPLATDPRLGWLLLPDGGTTLRTAQHGGTDIAHWAEILTEHADLQRRVAPHAQELVDMLVPDVRPEVLPQIRAELLDDPVALRLGRSGGLTPEEHDRLRADSGRYAHWCAELVAIGVPASINHDDLHDNNVFVPREPGGRYRVFDWGDASIAHPFAVLLVALRVVSMLHGLPPGDPALLGLRDAYLEPWTAEFDRADLVEAVRLALRVGTVSRALSYRCALLEGTPTDHDEVGEGVSGWLLEGYEPTPVEPAAG